MKLLPSGNAVFSEQEASVRLGDCLVQETGSGSFKMLHGVRLRFVYNSYLCVNTHLLTGP